MLRAASVYVEMNLEIGSSIGRSVLSVTLCFNGALNPVIVFRVALWLHSADHSGQSSHENPIWFIGRFRHRRLCRAAPDERASRKRRGDGPIDRPTLRRCHRGY